MVLSARTESDKHVAGGVGRVCRGVRGQIETRDKDKAKRTVSMAESGGVSEKESGEGRAHRTNGERREPGSQGWVEERGMGV